MLRVGLDEQADGDLMKFKPGQLVQPFSDSISPITMTSGRGNELAGNRFVHNLRFPEVALLLHVTNEFILNEALLLMGDRIGWAYVTHLRVIT